MNYLEINEAAYLPNLIAYLISSYLFVDSIFRLNLTMTESVSPYMTSASNFYITSDLVWSIIFLPNEVTEDEIYKHGSWPTVAPVKPYTELALIFSADCLPSRTFWSIGSVV